MHPHTMQNKHVRSEDTARGTEDDPLRDGLVLLCRELGRDTSAAELGDGLPLEAGRLPIACVARALRRVDVNARAVHWPIARLSARLLPALIEVRDGDWLLLHAWQGEKAVLLDPASGGGEICLTRAELEAAYAGCAVLARARARPDARAGDLGRPRPEHWLYAPLRQAWPQFAQVGLAAALANLLTVGTSLFAMQVYDRVVPNDAYDTLWVLASGVALALLMELVLRTLRTHLLDATGKRLDLGLSSRLFEQALAVRLAARPPSTGAFSSQLREFDAVRDFFTSTTAGAISDLPFVLLFIALVGVIAGPLALVPAAGALLMLLPALLAQRPLARLSREHVREGAVKHAMLLEAVENLEAVKATQAEGRLLQRWEVLSAETATTALRSRSLNAALAHGSSFVQQMAYASLIVWGAYRIGDGALTVGGLVACSILASRAMAPLAQASALLARWQHVKVALEGLDKLMAAPVERPAGRRFARLARPAGGYRLEGVQLRYAEDGAPALAIERLEIAAAERVALLGAMGAGKSTLLRLLAGLADPTQGRVLLDDLSLSQIDPSDRRRTIGYLPQDTLLFHGTLRDNLSMDSRGADDDERWAALEMVGLAAFVRAHPLGLDMPIAGNTSVSGGQRQAIGLARLLMQDPKVVLLDEPTASLDQETEQKVIRALGAWLQGRTLVLSTHKRSLLELVQRAIVLRQGQVAVAGPLPSVVAGREVRLPPVKGSLTKEMAS